MTCQEILDYLMMYLDDELPPEEARLFKEHLGVCPPCIEYLKTYRETIRLGRESCAEDDARCKAVPEELVRALLAARRGK